MFPIAKTVGVMAQVSLWRRRYAREDWPAWPTNRGCDASAGGTWEA